MILKITIAILLLIAVYSVGLPWLFNHTSPWLSIGLTIVATGIIAQFSYTTIKNQMKKNEKNENE